MRNRMQQGKTYLLLCGILLGSALASGCQSKKEVESNALVMTENEENAHEYTLERVKRGTIALTKKLNCTYTQAKEQTAAFLESGKTVEKVYVREGDLVKKGDILAELSLGTLEEDIAELEYTIAKNELQLGYLDTQENFELTDSYYALAYRSACTEDDVADWEERDQKIKQTYQEKREDYADALEFDQAKLAQLTQKLQDSRLYAQMDGMVYFVKNHLEGSLTAKEEAVVTIIDGSEGIFIMEQPEYASYFTEGEEITLTITYSNAAGEYTVTPYQMQTWGDKQYFSIVTAPELEGIEVDTRAEIRLVLEEKEDVLYLPNECIYKADDRAYVYVLDENNIQTACFLQIGLTGDTYTEIVEGITEGDMVIKR